jgi:hypothetical protein
LLSSSTSYQTPIPNLHLPTGSQASEEVSILRHSMPWVTDHHEIQWLKRISGPEACFCYIEEDERQERNAVLRRIAEWRDRERCTGEGGSHPRQVRFEWMVQDPDSLLLYIKFRRLREIRDPGILSGSEDFYVDISEGRRSLSGPGNPDLVTRTGELMLSYPELASEPDRLYETPVQGTGTELPTTSAGPVKRGRGKPRETDNGKGKGKEVDASGPAGKENDRGSQVYQCLCQWSTGNKAGEFRCRAVRHKRATIIAYAFDKSHHL